MVSNVLESESYSANIDGSKTVRNEPAQNNLTVESVQRDVGLKGQIGQKSVYKDNFFF